MTREPSLDTNRFKPMGENSCLQTLSSHHRMKVDKRTNLLYYKLIFVLVEEWVDKRIYLMSYHIIRYFYKYFSTLLNLKTNMFSEYFILFLVSILSPA